MILWWIDLSFILRGKGSNIEPWGTLVLLNDFPEAQLPTVHITDG